MMAIGLIDHCQGSPAQVAIVRSMCG